MDLTTRFLKEGSTFLVCFLSTVVAYLLFVLVFSYTNGASFIATLISGGLIMVAQLLSSQFLPFFFFFACVVLISLLSNFYLRKRGSNLKTSFLILLYSTLSVVIFIPGQIILGGILGIAYDVFANGNRG